MTFILYFLFYLQYWYTHLLCLLPLLYIFNCVNHSRPTSDFFPSLAITTRALLIVRLATCTSTLMEPSRFSGFPISSFFGSGLANITSLINIFRTSSLVKMVIGYPELIMVVNDCLLIRPFNTKVVYLSRPVSAPHCLRPILSFFLTGPLFVQLYLLGVIRLCWKICQFLWNWQFWGVCTSA